MKKLGSKKKVKKVRVTSEKFKPMKIGVFMLAFAAIGSILLIISHAAPNGCDTTGVLGTVSNTVSVPATGTYKVWVRMQVPDTTNTGNVNGVRLELAGASTQCFTVTTTSSAAVSGWQWVNTDATAASTPLITASMTSGNYTAKILGLKAGVKVDKVILLDSTVSCTPDNTLVTGGQQPGDNCTTAAPTVSLSAVSTSITSGSSTTLNWSSTDATACTATNGWTGSKNTSGSQSTGALTSTKTYELTCTGPGGTSSMASVTVTVTAAPAPTVSITASPTSVASGGSSTLTWTVTNATSCTASGSASWTGSKTASGTNTASTGALTATTTFALSCTGAGGTTNGSTTVTVTGTPPADTTPPTVTFTNSMPGVTVPNGATSVRVNDLKTITWTPVVTDTSGIQTQTVTVTYNGVTTPVTGSSYTFGTAAGSNGDYLLKVVATDNSTNHNQTTAQLTIQLRHPDFNRSGVVDIFDLSPLLSKWNTSTNPGYDLNTDNTISIFDLSMLLAKWNSTN